MHTRPSASAESGASRGGSVNLELLLALVLVLFAAWYGSCRLGTERAAVADDSYITYTYARNVADGHGLRFNATDPEPTSGCSTELHLLYCAAAISLGLDPLLATRGLSLGAVIAIGLLLGLCAARIARAPWNSGLLVGAATAFGLMLLPETGVHLASGMETMLFALVHCAALVWAGWASVRDRAVSLGVTLSGGIVLGALMLVRPEGWILALLYAAAIVVARVPRGGFSRSLRECAPLLVLTVVAIAALFSWRMATFGHLLGNPYYVKSANAIFGSAGALLPGLADVMRFVLLRLAPAVLVVAFITHALRFEARVWVPGVALMAPSLLVLALYTRAIHEMAGGFRYEYPLLIPWLGAGACALLAISLRSRTMYRGLVAGAVFIVPALASPVRPALWDYAQHARSGAIAWMDRRVPDNALSRAGRDLGATGLGERATILLSAAGQIPWHSRLKAVDWIGLNDTHLSGRHALGIDEVWSYLEGRNPDVVQSILPPAAALEGAREGDGNYRSAIVQSTLAGRGSGLFQHWERERFAQMVYREMRYVRENCVFGACYKLGDAWGEDWWVFLYVRKDSPHREALLTTMRGSKLADTTSDLSGAFAFDPRRLTE